MRRIFAANSLWSIAASIAQDQSSAKLCLAHELHELLFGHLGLFVSHIALVSKDRIRNAQQIGTEIALHGPSIEAAVGHTHNGNSA